MYCKICGYVLTHHCEGLHKTLWCPSCLAFREPTNEQSDLWQNEFAMALITHSPQYQDAHMRKEKDDK